MKKELALNKDAIQKEGIEIKITQSDVIDVLVGQQIENVMSQFRNLESRSVALREAIQTEKDKSIEKALAKIKIPEGLTFSHHRVSSTKSVNYKSIALNYIRPDDKGHTINLYTGTNTYYNQLQLVLEIYVKTTISDIELIGCLPAFTIKHNISKKLVEEITIHNAQTKAFEEIFPAGGINEKRLAKEIKNKFTKDMIKSMSPEFQKSLSSSFAFVV
jgi:hypothetical protein